MNPRSSYRSKHHDGADAPVDERPVRPSGTRSPSPAVRTKRRLVALSIATAAATTAAALGGSPANALPAEGDIQPAGTDAVVANSFVVVLKPSATSVDSSARDLASRYGGQVGHTYTNAIRGFQVSMSETRAKELAANVSVAYVQRNGIYHMSGTQTNPPSWGLDRIDQRNQPLDSSYTYPALASNVHAYIIDTGIRFSHNAFGGRAVSGYDAIDGGAATDCQGHGTHVAGTVGGAQYGVAKGVALVGVRVLDCSGNGTTDQVVAGIDWVTANAIKPAVANLSLGGPVDPTLDTAVANSISSGVTYGVSAGNGDTLGRAVDACTNSPARVPAAITVSATGSGDAKPTWANYGSCVDIFAPGVSIVSASNSSDTATATLSGTSMAAPHVVGAAALVLAAHPSYTPQQVRDSLVSDATSGLVTSPGSGSPNKLLWIGDGGAPPPPPPGCAGTNDNDVDVPDAGSAVTSAIGIVGCGHSTSLLATVEVHVVHTYRGDLKIDLVAPDGTTYNLKASNGSDGAADVNVTYPVVLIAEQTNGTWRLKVQDMYAYDSGYIDSWSLTV